MLLSLNIVEAKNVSDYYSKINQQLEVEVKEYIDGNLSSHTVAASYFPHIFPFKIYFFKNKKFGYEDVNLIPIGYSGDFIKDNYTFDGAKLHIKTTIENDTLIVNGYSNNLNIYKDGLYKNSFVDYDKISISIMKPNSQ